MDTKFEYRLLIVDDNQLIHDDFRKVLQPAQYEAKIRLDEICTQLFDDNKHDVLQFSLLPRFKIESAYQGDEALKLVQNAKNESKPYALAFVDVRMPPGMDGIDTIKAMWEIDPDIQTVICTAYSDYTWSDTINKLGKSDRLLILKKPFDNIELKQIACALSRKWFSQRLLQQEIIQFKNLAREKEDELEKSLIINRSAFIQVVQNSRMASIGQLAAGVAHEINNPIAFVISNYGLLSKYINALLAGKHLVEQADTLTECKTLLTESLEGLDRVKNIVHELRTFSRTEQLVPEYTDINACIDASIKIIANELKEKCKILKEYGELPPYYGTASQLKQVFLNILVNASHAISQKGMIHIKTYLCSNAIIIEIKDNGCGIAADKIGSIFDPFFTTKPIGQGTGLGLSISYEIITKHSGDIRVESKEGEGSTFIIELPIQAIAANLE